jgi:hypothetical protein
MSMMVLYPFAARQAFRPLRQAQAQAQAFVWMRLATFNRDVAGLRGMMVALAGRWLGAAGAVTQRQLSRLASYLLRRAWQGAHFAEGLPTADTMVAAAGR